MHKENQPKTNKVNAQPPIETKGIKVKKPPKVAGGVNAVLTAVKHAQSEMGIKRSMNTLFKMNQATGFDCPSCAWPDPDPENRSGLGEYCENGAKAVADEATLKRITPAFFQKYTVAELSTYSDHWLGKQGRITHPMYLPVGGTHYEPISWEDAFTLIAKELNALPTPDDAIFYTSGRTSNEAAFLYQLFVRQFGTNNLPDCSNMCHESSGVGLGQTLGIGKGSVKLEDFYQTELIIIAGQNPGTNHPRMLSALQIAKQNGAKIITINPLPEVGLMRFKHPQHVKDMLGSGTSLTDLFLQVKINGDVALLKAIMRLLADEDERSGGRAFDRSFILENTTGFDELIADLKTHDAAHLAKESGVSLTKIKEAVQLIVKSKKIIFCWAMGLTQHENGVDNITEAVNLLLLKGSIGKPGAGTCPVRGHSNVQGDRTVGIWERPSEAFLDSLGKAFNFEPPRKHGLAVVHAIEAMKAEKGKVFFAMGGNFISATPDTEFTAAALNNCRLTVQVSTKLNRSHLVTGEMALILPCLGRTEEDIQGGKAQFVTVENSMGIVHKSQGHLKPASEHLLSEPKIVAELAKATLGSKSTVDWDKMASNYDRARDAIEAVIPGFENYNERVRQAGGFYLPNCAREGKFNTKVGKAIFSINPLPDTSLQAGEYFMTTIRTHDQFNTTIYGLDDRYRGIYNGRRVVLMHPDDLKREGLKAGDLVNLYNHHGNTERVAECFMTVAYDIPQGCVATYFPEANVLVPVNQRARKSHTPASKSVVISMQKLEE